MKVIVVHGEEVCRPFAFTPVLTGVERDFQTWAGGACRGVPHQYVIACHAQAIAMVIASGSLHVGVMMRHSGM